MTSTMTETRRAVPARATTTEPPVSAELNRVFREAEEPLPEERPRTGTGTTPANQQRPYAYD